MNVALRNNRLGSVVGGKYQIARFLADGGMGAVYEAQHTVVKRRFAVKFLHPELAQRRDALSRFRLEAEAAGALENENIRAVVDFGFAPDGAPYLVMEYLTGCNLAELLAKNGPLAIDRATDLVLQACRGIQAAHTAGVIHRDLKPENVFVCRRSDGTDLIKILDFGIAKLQASGVGSAVTRTGTVLGTPAYMSPEQARGELMIDQRTDVYALGVILYELLSGRTPHPGDSHNAVIYHITTQPPLPLASEGHEFQQSLVGVVHRALSLDASERFASARALADELIPFARREIWPEIPDCGAHGHDSTLLAAGVARDDAHKTSASSPDRWDHTPSLAPTPQISLAPGRRAKAFAAFGLPLAALLIFAVWAARDSISSKEPTALEVESPGQSRELPQQAVAPLAAPAAPESTSEVAAVEPARSAAPATDSSALKLARSERPKAEPGRPRGRPAASAVTREVPAAADSQGSGGAAARFDPRNPYD